MKVLVNTSARFSVTPDGEFWAPSENLAYKYWTRFLDVFDGVTILARVFLVDAPMKGARPVSGHGVSIIPLPNYYGIPQFVRNYISLRKRIRDSLRQDHAVYLSLPCVIGNVVWRSLAMHQPYGVAVCGDPYDSLAPGATSHPLRPVMRWWFSRRLRIECKHACACTYVTKQVLQRRYPCGRDAFSTYYSSIDLSPDAIIEAPRSSPKRSGLFHLIHVGTFDTWYKGPDILLEALSLCTKDGLDLSLTLIGDGRYRKDAERLAEKLGVAKRVRFLGQLPFSAAVRSELDAADVFVHPSRTEGLPKALIEAMARGLPCIGTTVGGIPELLPSEDLVPPNDSTALSRLIEQVVTNPEQRAAMSARNLATAQDYRSDILRQRRIAFYEVLRVRTAAWLNGPEVPSLAQPTTLAPQRVTAHQDLPYKNLDITDDR
jgi:glycosyltransferase involved in cell wall biosynthesis